jgi:predicted metal-dependent HD superfamily phosphohydrolase
MSEAPLADRWPLPGSVAGDALREALLAAWASPDRGYHDLRHLTEVLDRLDELAAGGAAFPEPPVRLAAWFHDAVYDGARDDEERSAQWAERALPGLVPDDVVAETARLVRLTADHRPAPGDAAGEALTDADLAVLASGPDRYADYVAGVRREYAHVPDDAFAAGRAEVLRALLAKPVLFHTGHARARWETSARANVTAELARLAGAG